jgi:hypothetical protein
MSDITCAETAELLSEASPLGCRSPWEREMAKLALLNRIADGVGLTAANAASFGVVRSVSASTTILTGDYAILANSTAGAIAVTLPAAATVTGRIFFVKRVNAGANAVAVSPVGGEPIDGAPFHTLTAQWARIEFISNGSAWFIIAHQ